MGRATYKMASDGYRARVAPTWTEEKLRVLQSYLGGFAPACRSHPLGWYALDIFAGGGLNISETTGAEIPGSALIALEAKSPLAQRVILCEYSAKVLPALISRTSAYGDRVRVFAGDANAKIEEMLGLCPRTAPTFAFLDPEGSELDWTTVEAIAKHKEGRSQYRVEQLILLPTDMGFVRMLPLLGEPDEASAAKLTRMYGHDRWFGIYERRRANKITPDQARTEYVRLYAQGLRDLGYRHVQERQISKEAAKGTGASMYFLLHATDNDTGEQIMDHCMSKKWMRPSEELGQIPLLTVPVTRRQRRVSTDDDE